jgi:xanthine dehydrogenase YagS FAD-binding subunit
MKAFEWADAASIEEAVGLTINGAAYKAGGLDLLDLMKEHLFEPRRLVNLRTIPDLDKIQSDGKGLKLGPLVTLAEMAEHPQILKNWTALALASGHAATPQIRNQATLGGNLLQRPRCWYFRSEDFHCRKKGGEICFAQEGENQYHAIFHNKLCAIVHPSSAALPLVALGGVLHISDGKKTRDVKCEDFFTLPEVELHQENSLASGEIITSVTVPPLPAGARSYYIKQGEKESFDWPIAEAALMLEMDGQTCKNASIVLGAAAPVPYRAKEAEEALRGKPIHPDTAKAAADASMNDASPLARNGYKVPLFKAVVARAILACARQEQSRGEQS